MRKLCRTGWLNETSGRCISGVKSKKKGQSCKTSLDCPTTDSEVFAKCLCGHGDKGLAYCDVEGGDDEWQSAFSKFKTYYENSLNCHAAEGFGPCNGNQYYNDFKCAEMKAKLYVHLIDLPDCLRALMPQHPFFAEYYKYCAGLFGVSSSIWSVLLLLVVMFLSF